MGWEQVITIHSSPNNGGWGLLSHTVGLEPVLNWLESYSCPANTSPSHPVGLERKGTCEKVCTRSAVTIPHSGLRTHTFITSGCLNTIRNHHPTRWARNEAIHILWMLTSCCHHPTRWAWNHQKLVKEVLLWETIHHPTRWARNRKRRGDSQIARIQVTIPPSGLGMLGPC